MINIFDNRTEYTLSVRTQDKLLNIVAAKATDAHQAHVAIAIYPASDPEAESDPEQEALVTFSSAEFADILEHINVPSFREAAAMVISS